MFKHLGHWALPSQCSSIFSVFTKTYRRYAFLYATRTPVYKLWIFLHKLHFIFVNFTWYSIFQETSNRYDIQFYNKACWRFSNNDSLTLELWSYWTYFYSQTYKYNDWCKNIVRVRWHQGQHFHILPAARYKQLVGSN